MKTVQTTKKTRRLRRHKRIRSKIQGTETRPRLSLYRSNKYIYAQVINDEIGKTIAMATTKNAKKGTKPLDAANAAAEQLGKTLKEKGITTIVFDRGGFVYTGTIKSFAETLRSNGLVF